MFNWSYIYSPIYLFVILLHAWRDGIYVFSELKIHTLFEVSPRQENVIRLLWTRQMSLRHNGLLGHTHVYSIIYIGLKVYHKTWMYATRLASTNGSVSLSSFVGLVYNHNVFVPGYTLATRANESLNKPEREIKKNSRWRQALVGSASPLVRRRRAIGPAFGTNCQRNAPTMATSFIMHQLFRRKFSQVRHLWEWAFNNISLYSHLQSKRYQCFTTLPRDIDATICALVFLFLFFGVTSSLRRQLRGKPSNVLLRFIFSFALISISWNLLI